MLPGPLALIMPLSRATTIESTAELRIVRIGAAVIVEVVAAKTGALIAARMTLRAAAIAANAVSGAFDTKEVEGMARQWCSAQDIEAARLIQLAPALAILADVLLQATVDGLLTGAGILSAADIDRAALGRELVAAVIDRLAGPARRRAALAVPVTILAGWAGLAELAANAALGRVLLIRRHATPQL